MKFVEDDTLVALSKHLFAASGAMFTIATHLMTLQTLFSHPSEYAKRHRESPEVQGFKQNPSRESMVAYIASQTLSHTELAADDEQGTSVWDTLSPRSASREGRDTATFWDIPDHQSQQVDPDYDEDEEDIAPPSHRQCRLNRLEDDKDYQDDDEDAFNTPESSGERALFITQAYPEDFHEPGTLSAAEKAKRPASKKRPLSSRNVWAGFGLSAETTTTRAKTPSPRKRGTGSRGKASRGTTAGTTRGWSRATRGKRATSVARHIYFD